MSHKEIESSQLGKKTTYFDKYDPSLLYPISRIPQENRVKMYGYDLWHLYELSWLNPKGKPEVAIGNIAYDAFSRSLIESKSLKLYLNSFNNSVFDSFESVQNTIKKDLSNALETKVEVKIWDLNEETEVIKPDGICIDNYDIEIKSYDFEYRTNILNNLVVDDNEEVSEKLYSNLLRSNCPITGQPDWGTVVIDYKGPKISQQKLLQYIICYRNHNDFHEHCVESIYSEILSYCKPTMLRVYANYTRRGGIDINPYRGTTRDFKIEKIVNDKTRLIRQ
jgi:7-cyano-7-deazaguanine reductase